MNIGEAHAVNELIDYVAARKAGGRPNTPVTTEDAVKAAELLAKGAHKALGAGVRPEDVAVRWNVQKEAAA